MENNYKNWLATIKDKVRTAQIKVGIAANKELISFYWDLGKNISEELQREEWGSKVIAKLSKDLSKEFPEIKGFSETNLRYIKLFYEYFSSQSIEQFVIHHQLGDELSKDQLSSVRQQFTNFQTTLPTPLSDLAQQTLKDPYVFDFLQLSENFNERDIENQMLTHIQQYLFELGKGFAFIGRQYHLKVGNRDNYLDLLFYHTKLKCYVVIELKNTAFEPEYAGKLNYYLSAVDSYLKDPTDNPSIGILLCRNKDNIEVEFALRDISKPIGVSQFELTRIVPDNLKSSLPTITEIEQSLAN